MLKNKTIQRKQARQLKRTANVIGDVLGYSFLSSLDDTYDYCPVVDKWLQRRMFGGDYVA